MRARSKCFSLQKSEIARKVLSFIHFTHGFRSLHGSELTNFWKLCQARQQQLTFFNQAWEIGLQVWPGVRSKLSTCRHESWQVYFISLQAGSLVADTGTRDRATEPAKLVVRLAILVTSLTGCVALLRFLVPATSESVCRLLLYLQSPQCIEYETEYVISLPKTNVQFQKISILPPQKVLEFPGGWGVL